MSSDPFVHDDAAYVLGALDPADRAAFEAHLSDCADCRARVSELRTLPGLFAGITESDLAPAGPVPDTLLPQLLRTVRHERRRRTWLTAAGAAVAAALVVLVAVFAWPSHQSEPQPTAAVRPMTALVATPVHASVQLTERSWGTRITVRCRYDGSAQGPLWYRMVVVGRDGSSQPSGSWTIRPGQRLSYPAGTALRANQISRVDVDDAGGQTVLQLRL